MEKILYPSKYIRITQGFKEGTHISSYAIDEAGKDAGIDSFIAPFTGTIKKIYINDANEVWLESNDKVLFADGNIDYATVMFAHNNDISNIYVGKVIKQGENFYKEGTKGNATGNHVHIEIGKGKFSGTGWAKDDRGYWIINNSKNPLESFVINDTYTIIDSHGYTFKNEKDVNEGTTKNKYINLNKNIDSWRVYDMNVSPIKANASKVLKPSKFGGLSYTIQGYTQKDVAIIETRDYGRMQIYIGPNTSGKYSITDEPVYKLVK